jgi:hypothetical protein
MCRLFFSLSWRCEAKIPQSKLFCLLQAILVSLKQLLAQSAPDLEADTLQLLTTLVERSLVKVSGFFRPIAELLMLRHPNPHRQALAVLAAVALQGEYICMHICWPSLWRCADVHTNGERVDVLALASADIGALDDVDLRQRVLRYSLRSPPADASQTDVAVLFAALVGLPRIDTQLESQLPPSHQWCSDTVVNSTDTQLQALLRGEC